MVFWFFQMGGFLKSQEVTQQEGIYIFIKRERVGKGELKFRENIEKENWVAKRPIGRTAAQSSSVKKA